MSIENDDSFETYTVTPLFFSSSVGKRRRSPFLSLFLSSFPSFILILSILERIFSPWLEVKCNFCPSLFSNYFFLNFRGMKWREEGKGKLNEESNQYETILEQKNVASGYEMIEENRKKVVWNKNLQGKKSIIFWLINYSFTIQQIQSISFLSTLDSEVLDSMSNPFQVQGSYWWYFEDSMLKYSLKYFLFSESLNISEFSTQFRGNFSATSFLMQASSVSQDDFEFESFFSNYEPVKSIQCFTWRIHSIQTSLKEKESYSERVSFLTRFWLRASWHNRRIWNTGGVTIVHLLSHSLFYSHAITLWKQSRNKIRSLWRVCKTFAIRKRMES